MLRITKVTRAEAKGKCPVQPAHTEWGTFAHYVALDWSMKTMAIAHLKPTSQVPVVFERPTSLPLLKEYLKNLRGRICLTFEETTTSQWLYLELRALVDRLLICNPRHNKLLNEGPKTDKIDAAKLVLLLRAGLLKEVFHSADRLYELRTVVSAYIDIVQAATRSQNQRAALERAHTPDSAQAPFIRDHLEKAIAFYQETRAAYERQFHQLAREIPMLRKLDEVPGFGLINSAKLLVTMVDGHRFRTRGKLLAYCGLVEHEKQSGGRNYGRRRAPFSHLLKAVYKSAALTALRGHNEIRAYYDALLARGLAPHNARHQVARYLARVTWGMVKTGTAYEPYRWRRELPDQKEPQHQDLDQPQQKELPPASVA